MVKPFYQGKLDTFCAIYAVLNALRLTHSIRVLRARNILNETLMALATSPEVFRAVLEQETDYCTLVDGMLRAQSRVFPLDVRQPFGTDQDPSAEQVWDCCDQWLNGGSNRAIVFRFLRHITPDGPAVNRHKPAVDVLFRSVAQSAGGNAVGAILTGMGDDGARGLLEMSQAGAPTLVQDEATSVVWGMPGAAMRLGAAKETVPLERIAQRLLDLAAAIA